MSQHKANTGAWFGDKLGFSPAGRLMFAPRRWLCSKCGKSWVARGNHPDCDGDAADMRDVSKSAIGNRQSQT